MIPRKIHLTCKDKNNITNPIWKRTIDKYKKMYQDYEIIIYDNNDIYDIFRQHFPQYYDKIKQIKIGAVLADIFRYLILYLEGGIYSDMDCEPIKRIDNLLLDKFQYFHGGDDRMIYKYKKHKNLINKYCDFYDNVCSNYRVLKKDRNITHMRCLGHHINTPSVILSYEFHKDWHYNLEILNDSKWTYKNVSICQWFIISKPNQSIFLKMFEYCMNCIDILINLDKNNKNFHFNVINTSGPLRFTKIVMDNITDDIKILPSDFFCTGSWNGIVPTTNNSYVKHMFGGSWLD